MKTEQELKQRIQQLVDLKDLPSLVEDLERFGFEDRQLRQPELYGKSFYTQAHTQLLPNRLSELWFAGLLLDGKPLEDFVYGKMEPVFQKYLEKNGMEGQECFLCVHPEMVSEERPEEWTLHFFMGFDIFEGDAVEEGEEPDLPGWGVFRFTVHSWQYPSQSVKGIGRVWKSSREFNVTDIDWNGADSYYPQFYMEREGKMFYSRTEKGEKLWELFSDGGYTLRLD